MISIAVVNRFYPPDPAITGQSACELVQRLRAGLPEAKIAAFATGARYAGGAEMAPGGAERVHRIVSLYHGSNKVLRLASSLYDGFRLARVGTRNADLVISLTDPPLLTFWMRRAVAKRRRRWVEWTMDLYPEAFAAAGLVSTGNWIYKFFANSRTVHRPERLICLGPLQHAYINEQSGADLPAFILPSGVLDVEPGAVPDWKRDSPGRRLVAYAGNLGEAHPAVVVKRLVERAPKSFRFVFAPYGAKAEWLKRELGGAGNVVWRDSVPPSDLAHADVHLAFLKADWTNICVPSKAVSAICLGRPVVFAGSPASDNWRLLSDAGWLIPEKPDGTYGDDDIDRVLAEIDDDECLRNKTERAAQQKAALLDMKERAFTEIISWIKTLAREGAKEHERRP